METHDDQVERRHQPVAAVPPAHGVDGRQRGDFHADDDVEAAQHGLFVRRGRRNGARNPPRSAHGADVDGKKQQRGHHDSRQRYRRRPSGDQDERQRREPGAYRDHPQRAARHADDSPLRSSHLRDDDDDIRIMHGSLSPQTSLFNTRDRLAKTSTSLWLA
jgi:hypothetical protein